MANEGGRVLVVEDDEDVRDVLVEILRDEGFTVWFAQDGREALEMLSSGGALPEVVLLDLMMPRLNGAELLASARATVPGFSSVPVVVISASGHVGEHQIPPEAVSAWLRKPFELPELIATMTAVTRPGSEPSASTLRRRLLRYLSRQDSELARLRDALAIEDFVRIDEIGRRIGVTGRGFGVLPLWEAGERLAAAAIARDTAAVTAGVRELADVLLGLQARS